MTSKGVIHFLFVCGLLCIPVQAPLSNPSCRMTSVILDPITETVKGIIDEKDCEVKYEDACDQAITLLEQQCADGCARFRKNAKKFPRPRCKADACEQDSKSGFHENVLQ